MAKGEASDRSFVDQAYSINEGEIELGKLAQKRGTTPQVVEFGQRMAGDHRVAQEQLRDVALADNLTLPHRLQAAELDLYKRLAQLHGQKFDDAYVEHMVSGHKGAIALFQEQADHGQNPQLRAYAEKELPMLRAHEAIAKRDLQRM
ncbi:MAG TPA: DUF4142 domain-containing protein [Polyangia bacterium]